MFSGQACLLAVTEMIGCVLSSVFFPYGIHLFSLTKAAFKEHQDDQEYFRQCFPVFLNTVLSLSQILLSDTKMIKGTVMSIPQGSCSAFTKIIKEARS